MSVVNTIRRKKVALASEKKVLLTKGRPTAEYLDKYKFA